MEEKQKKIANASKRYGEEHVYSNIRPGNYDDYPRDVRNTETTTIMIIVGMNPVNMVTKRNNEDFSLTFLILINK